MKWLLKVSLLTVLTQSSLAQELPKYEDHWPPGCGWMSKDPRCWEKKPKRPQPVCWPKELGCAVIASVVYIDYRYYCNSTDGDPFDCTTIVAGQNAGNVIGKSVLVLQHYYDICHVPGMCGERTCVPTTSEASMDISCL